MIVNGNGISKNPIPIKYGVALGVHEIPLTTTQSEFLIAIPTLNNGIVTSDDLVLLHNSLVPYKHYPWKSIYHAVQHCRVNRRPIHSPNLLKRHRGIPLLL